ncbi:WD40 repeat domain-containing protein [Maribrevibacterium harenarium]|uniref:WD40 repeat domain-containing protein n=1 Tax=Maribrevibacterium harenarium TaxID=2589817 RepID=A0A501X3A5_9GAMM|nr:WD40 repeat domain-containing protein [Maribrevibacterium harenarium]TPE54980.1 WD40 repeat domain-containing protein [Maribrevibacterium harenarium]
MKRTAKKALKSVLAMASLALVACSAQGPSSTTEMAVQGLYSAALSDDGSAAIVGSIQHGGSYWSTRRGERRYNWNHAQGEFTPLISVDIDPSGDYGVTGGARTMVLWNTVTGQSAGFWNTPGDIKSLKLTRNGDFALVGMDDQTARYFDVKNGGILQTLRTGAVVRAVDVSADGRYGLTGDDKYQVILWDLQTGEAKYTWQLSNNIASVALSPDGTYAFAAAQLGTAKVWSTLTGRETSEINTGELQNRKVTISQAVFSKDSRNLLLGQVNRRVNLVSTATGKVQQYWDLHLRDTLRPTGASVLALAFGPGNTYYAIGSNGFLNVLK